MIMKSFQSKFTGNFHVFREPLFHYLSLAPLYSSDSDPRTHGINFQSFISFFSQASPEVFILPITHRPKDELLNPLAILRTRYPILLHSYCYLASSRIPTGPCETH